MSGEPVVLVASAEFTLKSSPVRRSLEDRLADDLRNALSRKGFAGFTVQKLAGRMLVRGILDTQGAAKCCASLFGVAYSAPAVAVTASADEVLRAISETATASIARGQTFAVRARRSTPSPLSRREIEVAGGSRVLEVMKDKNVRVDLRDPNVTIHIDLVGDHAYVYSQRLLGPGGFAPASYWKMLTVLDSGPLSILAAYVMMRRGCLTELFIPVSATGPYAKEVQISLARKLARLIPRPNYKGYVTTIDGEGTLSSHLALKRQVREMSLRFAGERKFKGVIFSDISGDIESLGKSWQGEATSPPPVFLPLVGYDLDDLLETAREIGFNDEELVTEIKTESGQATGLTFSATPKENARIEEIQL